MNDSDGNLSIDFLVGFTIFMIAFIWVATLVPNLFLGLSAIGIDYDAVAYRTGVILAEDPGATLDGSPWEVQPDNGKANIQRFGLAISKETPNVLGELKVSRFFNQSAGFIYPDDFRKKAIFGDYPYRFNISLLEVGKAPRYIGEERPETYGYIRKNVKIKHSSNATINMTNYERFGLWNLDTGFAADAYNSKNYDGNVTYHDFALVINRTELLHGNVTTPVLSPNYDAAYRIDPRTDGFNITVDDLDKFFWDPAYPAKFKNNTWVTVPYGLNLSKVRLSYSLDDSSPPINYPAGPYKDYIFIDTDQTTPVTPPVTVVQNVTFRFRPGFFAYPPNDRGSIYINMTFGVKTTDPQNPGNTEYGMKFLNSSHKQPWDYNYNATEVTQPELTDAVLEVAVW
jgi:hypothetical protein